MRTKVAAMLLVMLTVLAFCVSAEEVTPNSELPMPKFMKNVAVHDPSIIKAEDGFYYIFGSHMAAAKSADLSTGS